MTAVDVTVVDPSTTEELRERVREAAARRTPLRIAGGGSWMDANRPVDADGILSTRALAGIVEYVPGDLTLTARAGTTLADIARAAAEHGQWLALDPFGDASRSTIGATIATGSYGPLAHHFGAPRDMALGLEFVNGSGHLARGGGRVVKNVAGFDLTRLLTGSWGALGVVTEVTVRLRALPAVQATIAIGVGADAETLEHSRKALRELPFTPLAAQFLDARGAELAAGNDASPSGVTLLVRLGGNEEAVRAQREQLRAVGEAREIGDGCWSALRGAEPARAAVVRLSRAPARFAATWSEAARLAGGWNGAWLHGDPGRGVVRCVLTLDASTPNDRLRAALEGIREFSGSRIYERLPAALWPVCAPPRVGDRLGRGVKQAYDPERVLNPGILGDVA